VEHHRLDTVPGPGSHRGEAEDFWIFIYGANADAIAENGGLRPGQILYVPEF
jgi:hypothetical protein